MNALIVALGILACVALASSEPCQGSDTSSCTHEVCGSSKVACVHGSCTCIVDYCGEHNTECHARPGHCLQVAHQHHCPCAHKWHCTDSRCACGFPTSNSTAMRG